MECHLRNISVTELLCSGEDPKVITRITNDVIILILENRGPYQQIEMATDRDGNNELTKT